MSWRNLKCSKSVAWTISTIMFDLWYPGVVQWTVILWSSNSSLDVSFLYSHPLSMIVLWRIAKLVKYFIKHICTAYQANVEKECTIERKYFESKHYISMWTISNDLEGVSVKARYGGFLEYLTLTRT